MMRLCQCGHAEEMHSEVFGLCLGLPADLCGPLCGCGRFVPLPEQLGLVRRMLASLFGVRL